MLHYASVMVEDLKLHVAMRKPKSSVKKRYGKKKYGKKKDTYAHFGKAGSRIRRAARASSATVPFS